jgi:hypothetical protein
MSTEISFFVDGRIIVIERFEDETDPQFAERSSFILFFRNDPQKFNLAKLLSFHHTQKMFNGVTYKPDFEAAIKALREEIRQSRSQ